MPLDHVSISRHHATMRFEGGVTYVADMKSNNGTFVAAPGGADERVTTSRLREGSVVRFGAAPRLYVLRCSAGGLPRPAGDTWPRLAELGASPPVPKKPDAPPIPKRVRPESLAAVPPPPPSHDRRGDWREGDRRSTSPRANFGERLADRAARFGPPPGPPPFEARLADRAARFSPPPSPRGNFGEKKAARAARFGPPPGPSPFEARLAERAARFSPPPSPRAGDAGGGHRGPEPPRGFGPTALGEAVSRRLDADALRALAELETADADAVVQRLTQKGAEVRNPSAFVCQAVKTILGARRDGFARPGVVPPLPDGANPRKIRVKNITHTASESEIKAFFAAVGEVTDVQICKDQCFITFASAEAASRAIATMNNAEFEGRKLRVGWPQFDRCQFSHDGPQGRGRGGFGDARSAAAPGDGGGHRGPAPPHAPPPRCFGPTALREVVRSRLGERALRALAELETFEADAVVQSLEQAGATVRDPTAYVCKAVDTVRRRRRESGIAPPRARLDSLQRLPPPPSGDWICGACGGNNLFWRRECFRCGTPPTMESLRHEVEANFPGLPRRRRSRSRSRERRRRRGRRS